MNILKLGTSTLKLNNLVLGINVPTSSLLNNLVAYWKLDETSGTILYDSTSNHIDLTVGGSALINRTGKNGKSVSFSGNTTDSLKLPNNWSVNKFTGNTVSVSMWVYIVNTPTQPFYFFSFRNTDGVDMGSSKIYANYSTADSALFFACLPATPNWDEYTYTSIPPLIGQWQHFVFVSKGIGTDSILIYMNGVEVHERPFDMITAIDITLGGNYDAIANSSWDVGYNDTVNSYYDEIGVWNRALTAAEVKTLFNYGRGLTHPFNYVAPSSSLMTNLLGYWNFNEPSGTNLFDLSNGLLASANGATVVGATGKLGKAVSFDGVNESGVSLPTDFALNKFTNLFSVSFWIKFNSLTPTAGDWLIFDLHKASSGGDRIYMEMLDDHRIQFWFIPITPVWNEVISSSVITDTTNFMHIVGVVNGIGNPMKIYINNVDVTYATFSPVNDVDSGLGGINDSIGNSYYYGGRMVDAIIDEIGFWNKALTTTEIATLYNSGTGLSCPF
jgi:hypothetical protein